VVNTSPYEEAAAALESALNTEFTDIGVLVEHDNLHASLGVNQRRIGISPVREVPVQSNYAALQTTLEVKFYDFWDKEINPEQSVDPRSISRFAERFRRAVRDASVGQTPHYWFFNVTGIEYPNDPTGNKTRFVATVVAWSQNPAIVETSG
jgi:hypothetical protein